ncbi:MAG: type II secretion system protein [Gammaproteobacteria bacterium 13_2_20CM_66_19]|nr:MAG: type II secretion system protein [Gammaproteobacteria bacterium 13_2_20CM_66_19]TLY89351.1 MAG: type II secretion system F family protein [Gammaproteobacteria bacterium]TLZ10555.1 MAG: type II secretion system F family protein [Gammaproteobacteria bacterium]TLZ12158.1 MAG: type II secretion system F family protein [Gammaproteobacteria bacterium]TLZ14583.1 MAG: type II secretion system F family protein [Gammaproteobacteria bacterium]
MEFRIKALDASASVVSCVIDAVDEAEARRQLALRELKIISLEPVRRLRRLFQAPQLQIAVFSQQLVSLLEAGLSLVEALEALAQKESNAGTKHTLDRILARLYEGQTLAAAIAEHPATFPDLYVASVRASEKTGALREALTRYIAYQEQADTLRKTLVNACIYPAVLLVAGLLVTLFLMGYVVPRFSSIYEDVGTELPLASRLLLEWGKLIDAHAALVTAGVVGGLAGAIYGLARPTVRAAAGAWLARIPAIGRQLHVYQLARLYRTVGMLVRGGMPAVPALRMSGGVVLAGARAAYAAATRAVTEGQSLADAMERNGLTTPVAARMLRVGERSGNMGEMMERIADFCDEELGRWVAVMTRLIEPVLMIVIGLVIGVIVVLMYFPIFQLAGSIR